MTINHGLGRKPDSADTRDIRYAQSREAADAPRPPFVDLRRHLPPVYDQGMTNSCGAQAGAAMMAFLHPEVKGGFSRAQIYYDVRVVEDDVGQDDGVETRDVMKVLRDVGAIPEIAWPFDPKRILDVPSDLADLKKAQGLYRIGSYARLNSSSDFLRCLASGYPFVMGFMVPKSLDGDAIDKTGIMPLPNLKSDPIVAGHDVLCVGYDTTFKQAPFFRDSGLKADQVDDVMLLIRNSWGSDWSRKFRGHFWMPLSYAINRSTGGDAWTARRSDALKTAPAPAPAAAPEPTRAQLDASFATARHALDQTSYGSWVSDDRLRPISDDIARAVVRAG